MSRKNGTMIRLIKGKANSNNVNSNIFDQSTLISLSMYEVEEVTLTLIDALEITQLHLEKCRQAKPHQPKKMAKTCPPKLKCIHSHWNVFRGT